MIEIISIIYTEQSLLSGPRASELTRLSSDIEIRLPELT